MITQAESRPQAAIKALLHWAETNPQVMAAPRTRVSEVGFDIDSGFHADDSIFVTEDLAHGKYE